MHKTIISILIILSLLNISCKDTSKDIEFDVTSYHLTIEPDIDEGFISGSVVINFRINKDIDSVIFNSGNLEIKDVRGEQVSSFKKLEKNLVIYLTKRTNVNNKITIDYQGNPKLGLVFDPENNQAYTVYFTSRWMVCNDSPADKSLFNINIIVPNDKNCIASGELINKVKHNSKTLYSYQLNTESPSYTYGFAIGNFKKAEEKHNDVMLKYYAMNYSSDEIRNIFKETPEMISFFEDKSGVKYFQSTYSQILTGKNYQEAAGFSLLKDVYGKLVLQDSTETNLISHELSHQWWGNQITCKSWNHFWLNEGMATFMSAAYNEHRFGKKVYLSNIDSYYNVFEGIKKSGKDRSLVFEDWLNPTRDDRNLVYFKGAYVLHLLKEKLGDDKFWKAIRFYSSKYMGKSVETINFQNAIEESSNMNLTEFFNEWIY